MIQDSEISIIIQGPIHVDFVIELTAQTRKIFKNSQIIFSTWVGNNTSLIPSDILVVENPDPGALPISDNPIVYDSANRQIISTMSGLKKANRKYAIKMRSDILIEHNDWLKFFHKYQKYDIDYKLLKSRIIISSMFCVNPNKIPLPYHPSDWFFFGLTEDLIDIFDIPLLTEESANWFVGKERNKFSYDWHCRYRSEQHIWTSFIKKHRLLNFDHQNDIENNNIQISEKIFSNNTIILDSRILGMRSIKHTNYINDDFNKGYFSSNYYLYDWLRLYKKYSDSKGKFYLFNYSRLKNTMLWAFKNPSLAVHLFYVYRGLYKYALIANFVKFVRSRLKPSAKD